MTEVPDNQLQVTDSWRAYQDFTNCVQDLLREIAVRGSEVWLGEVCLGSPDRPWIGAPLRADSTELLHRSIGRAKDLIDAVSGSLQRSVEASRRLMKDLAGKGASKADLTEIGARTDVLDRLLHELTDAATLAPFAYHPAILIRWCGLLGESLVAGDGTVRVKVTTVYVL